MTVRPGYVERQDAQMAKQGRQQIEYCEMKAREREQAMVADYDYQPPPERSRPSTHWLKVPPYRPPAGEFYGLGPPALCGMCCYFDKHASQNCAQLDKMRHPEDRGCIWGRRVMSLEEALTNLEYATRAARWRIDPPSATYLDDEIPF